MGYCIIIPAYNAASTLYAVAAEALRSGAPLLVVDDGSTDRTSESVRGLPVNLIRHDRNRGKGPLSKALFLDAPAWIPGAVTLDADGQHDAGAIPFWPIPPGATRPTSDRLPRHTVRPDGGFTKIVEPVRGLVHEETDGFDITDSSRDSGIILRGFSGAWSLTPTGIIWRWRSS